MRFADKRSAAAAAASESCAEIDFYLWKLGDDDDVLAGNQFTELRNFRINERMEQIDDVFASFSFYFSFFFFSTCRERKFIAIKSLA